MEFPSEVRFRIEQMAAGQDIKIMTAEASKLSMRYRNDSGKGKSLVSDSIAVLTYAAVRMPATFGAVSKALELTMECFDDDICSVLDVGAGTGAASCAAWLVIGCDDITCLERENNMAELGKQLTEACGVSANWINKDISSAVLNEHADLVVSSYCLNELSEAARKNTLNSLWKVSDKLLLIVEPGTPEGFSQLREARKQLIASGGHVVAPCPHNGNCMLSEDDWCHFTARVSRTKLHKQLKGGDAPYEDEKFCFLAVSKSDCQGTARILRHPRIESGKITLRVCTKDGIADRMITKKSPLFKRARKSDSGDSFPIELLEYGSGE